MPVHLRTNWDSFYVEILMLAGLGVYFLNFLQGKNKNHKLAQSWLNAHRDLLEQNFSIVGRCWQNCGGVFANFWVGLGNLSGKIVGGV